MKLKNYTSTIPTSRTIARIEEILAETGAKAIGKNYGTDRKVENITFQLSIEGHDLLIRLPSNPQAVFDELRKAIVRPHAGTLDNLREQAERTAWKLQQDWLEVELSLIRLKQKQPLESFLAYVWDGRTTYYNALKDGGFRKLLAAPKGEA